LVGRNFALIPAEALWADASQSLIVSVLAAGDELEAKINVLLLLKDQTAENEVSAIEAGKVTRLEFESSMVERGQVSKIWT
jgi:hypothetical protein